MNSCAVQLYQTINRLNLYQEDQTMKMKKIAIFLVALVLMFALVACDDNKKPSNDGAETTAPDKVEEVKDAITLDGVKADPFAAVADGGNMFFEQLGNKLGDSFSAFEKFAGTTSTYTIEGSIANVGDLEIEAIVDGKTGAYSAEASVGSMGISMNVDLWGDKDTFVLSAPAFLGEGNYGVKLDTLEADIENSPIMDALLGGMSLDEFLGSMFPEGEGDVSLDAIEGILSEENLEAAVKEFTDGIEEIFKDTAVEVKTENYKIGDTEVPVVSVALDITKDNFIAITELFDDVLKSTLGDLYEMLEVSTDMEIDSEFEKMSMKYYLSVKTGALVAIDIDAPGYADGSVVFGEIGDKLNITAEMTVTDEGETSKIEMSVKSVDEKGKDGFVIDVAIDGEGEDGDQTVSVGFARNTADGKFEIVGTEDGIGVFKITGALVITDTEFTFSIDSFTVEDETMGIEELSVSVKVGGTVEAVPEFINVLTAPLEDLAGLMSALEGIFGGGDYDDDYDDDYYGEITLDDLLYGLTDEEIEEFYQDIEDMGMTVDEYLEYINDLFAEEV